MEAGQGRVQEEAKVSQTCLILLLGVVFVYQLPTPFLLSYILWSLKAYMLDKTLDADFPIELYPYVIQQ